jgi:hypothetical protein
LSLAAAHVYRGGKGRGTLGRNIAVDLTKADVERERVYAKDWYDE